MSTKTDRPILQTKLRRFDPDLESSSDDDSNASLKVLATIDPQGRGASTTSTKGSAPTNRCSSKSSAVPVKRVTSKATTNVSATKSKSQLPSSIPNKRHKLSQSPTSIPPPAISANKCPVSQILAVTSNSPAETLESDQSKRTGNQQRVEKDKDQTSNDIKSKSADSSGRVDTKPTEKQFSSVTKTKQSHVEPGRPSKTIISRRETPDDSDAITDTPPDGESGSGDPESEYSKEIGNCGDRDVIVNWLNRIIATHDRFLDVVQRGFEHLGKINDESVKKNLAKRLAESNDMVEKIFER